MKEKKKIGRREFLKVAGTGAAVTTAALYGCKPALREAPLRQTAHSRGR